MLNHIIRLQAVVKIITNETARAHYLLASEGGVCGKFNLSNCCLQIDDEGKVIEETTDRMRKLTHVPVQTWRGWDGIPRTCLEGGSLP
jgi:hypothetical protein